MSFQPIKVNSSFETTLSRSVQGVQVDHISIRRKALKKLRIQEATIPVPGEKRVLLCPGKFMMFQSRKRFETIRSSISKVEHHVIKYMRHIGWGIANLIETICNQCKYAIIVDSLEIDVLIKLFQFKQSIEIMKFC